MLSGDEKRLSKEATSAKVLCFLGCVLGTHLYQVLQDNDSLKHLSEKLVVLLALTSAECGSEMAVHNIRFRKLHPEGREFNLPKLTKSVCVAKSLKASFHVSFPQDQLLRPCECPKVYESLTSTFRPLDPAQPSNLFLATIRPHKPVRSAMLAHWIKKRQVLILTFSKLTLLEGLHLLLLQGQGCQLSRLSNDNTFWRFYYKPVSDPSFRRAVLSVT